MLLPFNYLVSSNGEGMRNPLASYSLHVLLILNYYHKCIVGDEPVTDRSDDSAASDSIPKANTYFSDNPYCKALESARDIEREINFSLTKFFLLELFLAFSLSVCIYMWVWVCLSISIEVPSLQLIV